MKPQKALRFLLLLLGLTSSNLVLAQDGLIVSEILAANSNTIKDDAGESSDYVELYNGGTAPVNLAGYYLTDTAANLTQWQFPATNLPAGRHLLIWASGRDRRVAGAPLHTNFRLGQSGEAIYLVKPDRQIAHGFEFGPQATDRSYGLTAEVLSTTSLVASGAQARYLVPTNNAFAHTNTLAANRWTSPTFNDSTWRTGATGFGFDSVPASLLTPFIGTDTRALMFEATSKRSGLYARIPFTIPDLNQIANPSLQIRYDDGFIAYLNGVEFARRGFTNTSTPNFNSTAQTSRTNSAVIIPESLTALNLSGNLRQGENVLAIHGLNRSSTDLDFLIQPELTSTAIRYSTNSSSERYFPVPSPGGANTVGFEGASGEVTFSTSSTTYFNPFELVLTSTEPTTLSKIYYTINGSVPTTNSLLYSGPIQITNSVQVRARLFDPGFLPGPVRTEAFMRLNAQMRTASSDLPMILVHSFNSGAFDQTLKRACVLFVHQPVQGRASFTNAPDQVFRAGLKIRGSSTAGNPKYNWAVDAWDEENRDTDIPLLGMPEGSEWVFHAPFNFDPSLFHNPLASQMSEDIGRYASRYRFAEVYLNEGASTSTNSIIAPRNYFGVYNIMERIGVGPNRVDIDKLSGVDVQAPEVSGGYLLSIDRDFGGTPGFTAAGQTLNYIEPKYEDISLPERDPQEKYIAAWFNEFGRSLGASTLTNPVTGYTPLVDIGAAIDHHLINVISFNVDALRLSGYLYKERDKPGQRGRLVFGPVWDFDRAFGSTDGRDADPLVWKSQTGDGGTDFFNYPWWDRMFRDPNFWQAYIDRFQELREGVYSTAALFETMDRLNDQVKESAARDLTRWSNAKRGGNQAGELAFFKNWMRRRLEFMDGNFKPKPDTTLASGQVAPGTKLTLNAAPGGTIYYTLDGTDPRALHGGLDPKAIPYTEPITITSETRLVARVRDLAHRNLTGAGNPPISSPWSGPLKARYTLEAWVAPGDLAVTEINFHPSAPTSAETNAVPGVSNSDFEFLELQNLTNQKLDLYGAKFTKGMTFTFTDNSIYTLEPQEIVVLVKNQAAYTARYGNAGRIAGVFTGSLNDAGDTVRLEDSRGIQLLEFTYSDSWHPTTDGLGFSLERVDLEAGDGSKEAWSASTAAGGSPGFSRPNVPALPLVLVNEVLANPGSQASDSIELLNRSSAPANISGWFLTDDRSQPFKYRFPNNTVIGAGAFSTVSNTLFNAASLDTNAFGLSSHGDSVWLFSADAAGKLTGYAHGFNFGASDPGVSFGRYLLTHGKEVFPSQREVTLGRANTGPKIGPVVIREIHYHPSDLPANGAYWNNTLDEYIEIQNISSAPLALYDAASGNEWHVRGDADFNFPTNSAMAAGEVVLLVKFDPAAGDLADAFRAKFGVSASIRLFGPLEGDLNNDQGDVRISKPGPEDADTGDISYVTVDEVDYLDHSPWTPSADGAGASLQRIDTASYGNDPANWKGALPSPGANTPTGQAPVITLQPASKTVVAGTSTTLTVGATGEGALKYQWRFDGRNLPGANGTSLTLNPLVMEDAGSYSAVVIGAAGSVASDPAILTVLQPATIITHPETRNVRPGTNVTFSVKATGSGNLSYQWFRDGQLIPGATDRFLSLQNVQLADVANYTVQVTDSIGSSLSNPARLNVLVRPSFVYQPSSQVALVGDTVQFEVEMAGLEPFSYRWRKANAAGTSFSNITGATNRTYRLTNVQLTNAGLYSITVTNMATTSTGTNSLSVRLIVMNDADKDGVGDEWEALYGFSSSNATDANRDDDGDGRTNREEFIAGTDPKNPSSVLRIDSIQTTTNRTSLSLVSRKDRGYTVQFREALNRGSWQTALHVPGRTNNDAAVTVFDPLPGSAVRFYRLIAPQEVVSVGSGPKIVSSPVTQTVDEGDPVVFEVLAVGEGQVTYQWFKNGEPIANENASTLSIVSAKPADQAIYTVRVQDADATDTTEPAQLVVLQKPTLVRQPESQVAAIGSNLTLTVEATGVGTLSYQWLKDGQLIDGATGASLSINGVKASDAGSYSVSVRMQTVNGQQKRTSNPAIVRISE
ncbi:MAG: immunoglobulin domain-containing protein [Verrucomicrobiales bacterium]|nr:immunoglobulin domain-containing protein [Verrucomicrobiales bacterium]